MGRALAAWLLVGSALAAPPATPREVVESAVTRVVSKLHDANLNARATEQTHRLPVRRRAEITRLAADLFDYEEVARLTLPRYWAVRTPQERAETAAQRTDHQPRRIELDSLHAELRRSRVGLVIAVKTLATPPGQPPSYTPCS